MINIDGDMMVALHPQFIRSGEKNEFVVLPHDEFVAMCDLLEDLIDLQLIEKARAKNASKPGISLEQLKVELGMD